MHLSIVTGTYNRLELLQRMIQSVRDQMPRHLSYEFVVVDGGSTDGTQRWCLSQANITYLNHGRLLGAIRAFGDGANAAQGDYVVMANDDIAFRPGSLLRAFSYLEEHRTCGAVAFADNRTSQIRSGVSGHRVEYMPATGIDNRPTAVIYAQVGMFRRWLGDRVGWWGAEDEHMGKARTYGGDNYLSAGIWSLGYSVDAVDGCEIDDLIEADHLRVINASSGENDSRMYYLRYPRGPQVAALPRVPNPQRERLRVLVADIHESRLPAASAQEQGLADAFNRVGLTYHIDYVNEGLNLPAAVREWQPHLILLQMHDSKAIGADSLRLARQERPDTVIVNWNGDAHESGLIAPDVLEVLREVDLQTGVNAAVKPVYDAEGIPWAYWQIGYKDPATTLPEMPAHEVLFMGNCYNDARYALIETLHATPHAVAVYGNCPGALGNTHYDFSAQQSLYSRAKLTISDTFPDTVGFVSNRLFQALAAGAFLLQQHSPELDAYTGLIAGEHYIEWQTLDDLPAVIDEWLAADRAQDRQRIAETGQAFVRAHFSYDAQVGKLWDLLPV